MCIVVRNNSDITNISVLIKTILFLLFSSGIYLCKDTNVLVIFIVFELIIISMAKVPLLYYVKSKFYMIPMFLIILVLLISKEENTIALIITKFLSIYLYFKTMFYYLYKKKPYISILKQKLKEQMIINNLAQKFDSKKISKINLLRVSAYKAKKKYRVISLRNLLRERASLNFYSWILVLIHIFFPIIALVNEI